MKNLNEITYHSEAIAEKSKSYRIYRSTHRRAAFTLAEILITLSILGVVAAISIPNLIQNYQKQATVSRLKMAYSMLDRLIQQSYIENGYPPVGIIMNKNNFDKYFGKYLNITKDCGGANQVISKGCFKSATYKEFGQTENAKDKDGNEKKTDMFYDLDGNEFSSNQGGYGPSYFYKVLLKNGMSLGVNWSASYAYSIRFVVDIDGPNRGQSKLGQDVFMFTYYSPQVQGSTLEDKTTGSYIWYTRCPRVELFKGGYNGVDEGCNFSRDNLKSLCKKDGSGSGNVAYRNGSGCSGLIIMDGWKISNDYPWSYANKK